MAYDNNYKPKKEQPKEQPKPNKRFEAVINKPAKVKKSSGIKKVAGDFVAEDASNVFSYVLTDVVLPSAKRLLSDMVTKGLDMLLYGESARDRVSNHVSYNNYYKEKDSARARDRSSRPRNRTGMDYPELITETRGEADRVKAAMIECAARYGIVTIASMYEFARRYDLIDDNYMLHNYGWTLDAVSRINIVPTEDGYWIKTPKAMPID